MKPAPFDYCRPATLDEALDLLARHGADATVLAGGVSLGAMLNMRLARPRVLVDIKAIPGLAGWEEIPGVMRTGPALVQADAMASVPLLCAVPLLGEAFPHIGHMQTRNRGTLGGSIAHADPSAELPLVLATLGGQVELTCAQGVRRVDARDFFVGVLSTVRRPDELVTAIEWPRAPARSGHAFDEIAQRTGDFAIAAVAAQVRLTADGTIAAMTIGFGGVQDRPVVVQMSDVRGEQPSDELARAIASQAARDLDPMNDVKASRAYRLSIARTLAERVVQRALQRVRASLRLTEADGAHANREIAGLANVSGANASDANACGAITIGPATAVPKPGPSPSARPGTHYFLADARATIRFTLNGRPVRASAEPRMLLSDCLRHELHAFGVRVGCEHGVCGACTVLMDGKAVRSCLQRAVEAEGRAITTVEGLSDGPSLNPLQEAFRRHHALQCGFCTPGILASATQFLRDNPDPSEHAVRDMLSGHLCRCTGYAGIVRAILDAAATRSS